MLSKLGILAFGTLAVIPAAALAMWPQASDSVPLRDIAISGPIQDFSQSRDRIQVRLLPAVTDAERQGRKAITIQDAQGDQLIIPLKPGQTWASGELPPALANSGQLDIRVE